MKRSDMIDILEEAILDNYDYCVDAGWTVSYDRVLEVLEEAGMLPPESRYKYKAGLARTGTFISHTWESEDE